MKRKFVIDEEISFLKENDILKTKVYADSLVKIIKNTPQDKVFTIGLFGSWGSGKSSIIKTAKDTIEAEDDKVKFITYDAWKYVNDSFRRMFLLKIQQELKQGQTDVMQRFYQSESVETDPKVSISPNGLLTLVVILMAITFLLLQTNWHVNLKIGLSSLIGLIGLFITIKNGIFQQLKIQISKPIIFAPEQFELCFREMISKSLKKRGIADDVYTKLVDYTKTGECSITNLKKLVIVIDNIDRCHNEMAYQLLTDIKTFLSDEKLNVVFVIPVDDEALKRNLFSNNDCNKEKEEFLRKFFNVTLRIKPHQTTELNSYARELNDRNKLGFNANTIALCCKEFAKNPRRIIQLFNNLSSELAQYSNDFAKKNESAICAVLILREEYPDYYNKVIDNPSIFRNCETDKKEEDIASFMRFVGSIAREIELKDLHQILTNSDAVFEAIPEPLKGSIYSYDAEETIKFIKSNDESKSDILALITRNIKEDINSKADVQIINSLEFVSTLSVHIDLEQVFLNEINLLYQPYYADFLDRINDEKLEDFCRLALTLHNNGFEDLKSSIIEHASNINNENEKLNELLIKVVFIVFNTDEDSKKLNTLATKVFNTVDIYSDIQYTESQLNYLFSEELVQAHINAITIGDNKETEKLLWLFKHKKNITEESYTLLFKKIYELIVTTTSKEKSVVLTHILYVMKYLQFIDNYKINDIDNLVNLNKKLDSWSNRYGNLVYILDEYKTEPINLHLIIDYIMHMYRISNSVITTEQINKMCLHDKEYTYSKLMNLLQQGYDLKPFHNAIMNDEDYSLDNLIPLTEHCLMMKEDYEYDIDNTTIWDKFNSLLDNITDHRIQELIERLVLNQSVKAIMVEAITRRDAQYINALPKSLLRLAVNSFNEETALLYKGNMDFLMVIASNATTKQKKELTKVLTDNINHKNHIDKTFEILETLQLEKEYNKQMICSALQSYKDSDNTNDARIDKLIEKYRTESY